MLQWDTARLLQQPGGLPQFRRCEVMRQLLDLHASARPVGAALDRILEAERPPAPPRRAGSLARDPRLDRFGDAHLPADGGVAPLPPAGDDAKLEAWPI
jgi:hypothetical protein